MFVWCRFSVDLPKHLVPTPLEIVPGIPFVNRLDVPPGVLKNWRVVAVFPSIK